MFKYGTLATLPHGVWAHRGALSTRPPTQTPVLTPAHCSLLNARVFRSTPPCSSAYESSLEALRQPTIRVCAIIAEGVPERDTKQLIAFAQANKKIIIGPATVGGVQARWVCASEGSLSREWQAAVYYIRRQGAGALHPSGAGHSRRRCNLPSPTCDAP